MSRKIHPPHMLCHNCRHYSAGAILCDACAEATKLCRVPAHADTINGGEGGAWVRVELRTGKGK